MDGKEGTKVKVNDNLRGQGLHVQMRNTMWHHKRDLMQLDMDMGHISSSIEVRALVGWSVGHAVRSTLRDIVHQNHGGKPHIYSAQEVHTIGDVGQSIPRIYVAVDNR